MKVRQILVASVLAVTAVGAMSQEVNRSKTLQGKSLAAQQERAAGAHGVTRAAVVAETRNAEATGELTVGERSDAPIVKSVPNSTYASGTTRASVRKDLAQWRQTHKVAVGDLG